MRNLKIGGILPLPDNFYYKVILPVTSIVKFISILQDSDGQGCPFCRCEIKGTEQVVVDPFNDQHERVKRVEPKKKRCSRHMFDDEITEDVSPSYTA